MGENQTRTKRKNNRKFKFEDCRMIDLNKSIQEKQEQINKLNRDIEELKKDLNKVTTVIINGYEYETKTHDFNKCLKDIVIPKGWELWSISDFEKFSLKDWDTLNLKDDWFYIKYPFAYNPNNYVAWFGADSDRAYLGCNWNPSVSDASLGVRFVRKVKEKRNEILSYPKTKPSAKGQSI